MANNPYVNKVETADGSVIMDISSDTVTPNDVLNGVTFHDRSGAAQQGSVITHNVYDGLDSTSTSDALSAKQGKVLNDDLSTAIKSVTSFVVPANSSKTITITSSWDYNFFLIPTNLNRTEQAGTFFFINGYASASRGVALKLGSASVVSIDMTSTDKKVVVSNTSISDISFTIIPFSSGQSFSIS